MKKDTQGSTDRYIGSWMKSKQRDKVLTNLIYTFCKFSVLSEYFFLLFNKFVYFIAVSILIALNKYIHVINLSHN